jgi:peptidoglycan hydrolase-like protein with peptidoglycan-binding domain
MSKLFITSNEEKNRILNLHENAILKEKILGRKYSKLLTEDEESLSEYGGEPKSKIESVQQALVDLGYDLGKFGPKGDGVDGNFGSATKAAVIKFQTDKGISPNKGFVGPKTAAALGVEQLTPSKQTTPSDGADTGAGSATSSPFNTKEEGDAFRKFMHRHFPNDVKSLDLDIEGSHTNETIKNAFDSKPKGWTNTTYGQYYLKNKNKSQPSQQQPDRITKNISPFYKYHFDLADIDSTRSEKLLFPADTTDCGQFVNNLSPKIDFVGNAWLAHDNEKLGPRIKTGYRGLDDTQVKAVNNIFQAIVKKGGPVDNGSQSGNIKQLTQQLIPSITPSDLKIDDVVGIYYPTSSYFEKAFFQGALSGYKPSELPTGRGYFIKDGKGGWKPGKTLSGGDAFGMNTHVGIVGAIKDGVPIIFHNISGIVHVDPYNKLVGGGKIMWVRRPS